MEQVPQYVRPQRWRIQEHKELTETVFSTLTQEDRVLAIATAIVNPDWGSDLIERRRGKGSEWEKMLIDLYYKEKETTTASVTPLESDYSIHQLGIYNPLDMFCDSSILKSTAATNDLSSSVPAFDLSQLLDKEERKQEKANATVLKRHTTKQSSTARGLGVIHSRQRQVLQSVSSSLPSPQQGISIVTSSVQNSPTGSSPGSGPISQGSRRVHVVDSNNIPDLLLNDDKKVSKRPRSELKISEPTVLCPVRVSTGCSVSFSRVERDSWQSDLRHHLSIAHKLDDSTVSGYIATSTTETATCHECDFQEVTDTPISTTISHLRQVHKYSLSSARNNAESGWRALGRLPKKK